MMLAKGLKITLWIVSLLIIVFIMMISALFLQVRPRIPELAIDSIDVNMPEVRYSSDSLASIGNNKFRKNRYGLYELYVEGNAFERGLNGGLLTQELVKYQEEIFVKKLTEIIPSRRYRNFLQSLIIWFNSRLHEHVHDEFIEEIYGISQSASKEFDSYGPAFYRLLNYHAAHDIGHTMQAYSLVGCSSFAVWDENSSDSSLLVGRNFDFFFGSEFAENKIIQFVKPDEGHNFAFITWGGMTGAVSGMNDKGLTVTINAGTPSIAKRSGTPVSLLAREILQFAANIDEAIEIAENRNTFVSESFFIASAVDRKAVIVEKTPDEQSVFKGNNSALLCTNHYQAEKHAHTEENLETIEKATGYRFERMNQLVAAHPGMTANDAAKILRDQKGLNEETLGLGNEMAMNQLIAHHSVLFSPEKKIIWVSTAPNVMGAYVAYDLNNIFNNMSQLSKNEPVDNTRLEIPSDAFLATEQWQNFIEFQELKEQYIFFNFSGEPVADSILNKLVWLNPDSFEPYLWKANQYMDQKNFTAARENINLALTKAVTQAIKTSLLSKLETCNKEIEKVR
jgi:predicted choloylglycine hydrolase